MKPITTFSQLLENEKTYISFGNHPNSFYACFACQIYAVKSLNIFIGELRSELIYVLKKCLPGNEPFAMKGFFFDANTNKNIYKSLLKEMVPSSRVKFNVNIEDVIDYITCSRSKEEPTRLDKEILCLLYQVSIKEIMSDGNSTRYNPQSLDCNSLNTINVFFLENTFQVASKLRTGHSIAEYGVFIEMLCAGKCSDASLQGYANKVNICLQFFFRKFNNLVQTLERFCASLFLQFLTKNKYELTKDQQDFVNYYLSKLNIELTAPDGLDIREFLGDEIAEIFLSKIVDFSFGFFVRENFYSMLQQFSTPSAEVKFFKHFAISGRDLIFLRLYDDKISYGFDSIYYMLYEYSLRINALELCNPLKMRRILFNNFIKCLDEDNLESLVNHKGCEVDWVYAKDFKLWVRQQVFQRASLYNLSSIEYIRNIVLYGPLDYIAKVLLSLIIGAVIQEFDLCGKSVEYRAGLDFPYDGKPVILMQDANFSINCSYYTPACLDILHNENIRDLLKYPCEQDRRAVHRSQEEHERDKHHCITMFTVAINYVFNEKYMVHCPVSKHGYLLPIMMFCLQNNYLNGQTLDDLPIFRRRIVNFFISQSNDAYSELMDSLMKGLHEFLLNEACIKKYKSQYEGFDERNFILRSLYEPELAFPVELIQVVADFMRLKIVVYNFVDGSASIFMPTSICSYNDEFEMPESKTIYLQSIGKHYNLLTRYQFWQLDHDFIGNSFSGYYDDKKRESSNKNSVKFQEDAKFCDFDKDEEPQWIAFDASISFKSPLKP